MPTHVCQSAVRQASTTGSPRWCRIPTLWIWTVMTLLFLLGAITATEVAAQQAAVFPGLDWEERTPESQGLDASKFQAAVEYLKRNAPHDGTDELVIVRHGFVIWQGAHSDRVHDTWSVTKSFTSTVLGLLVDDGRLTLDTKVQEVLPSLAAVYPDITYRHLTTMTSGYQALGDEPAGWYTWGPSATPFTPSPTPLFSPPGTRYAYWDSAMNQLAHALTRVAGEPLRVLFKHRIADSIGMPADQWYWGDFGMVDGEVDVVEVVVYDVLLRIPKGVEVQWPQDASKVGRMALVVLKEREGERTMGIWVGVPEANAMIQPLAKLAVPRPMTHDLLSRLLEVNNTHVEKVAVTTLHDTTFYATLWLRVGERVHEVDARPSDALSLALRLQVPIFVATDLFAQQSQHVEQMRPAMVLRSQQLDPPGDAAIELRSFRSLLGGDVGEPLPSLPGT